MTAGDRGHCEEWGAARRSLPRAGAPRPRGGAIPCPPPAGRNPHPSSTKQSVPNPKTYHPSARFLHSGFIPSISATFFARDPALICFSRAIAAAMFGVVS